MSTITQRGWQGRARYASGIARSAAESEYPQLWHGLTYAWCPSLGVNGAILRDWGQYKQHGTLTNGVTWEPTGLRFDGVNDYVDLPNTGPAWDINTPGAVSWWHFSTDWGSQFQNTIHLETAESEGMGWFISNHSSYPGINAMIPGRAKTVKQDRTVNPPDWSGTWMHIACSFDGVDHKAISSYYYYINGFPYGAREGHTVGNVVNSSRLGTFTSGVQPFKGILDDMRVYNRQLFPTDAILLATRPGIAFEKRRRITSIFFDFLYPARTTALASSVMES